MTARIRLDTSDFDNRKMALLKYLLPRATFKAMGQAGMQLMADSVIEVPTAPIDTGRLRGSASVFVNNKIMGVSPKVNGEGTPAVTHTETVDPNRVYCLVGFNTPYATTTHEVPMNFHNPGSGNKYLEKKLYENSGLYFAIIANVLKAEFR